MLKGGDGVTAGLPACWISPTHQLASLTESLRTEHPFARWHIGAPIIDGWCRRRLTPQPRAVYSQRPKTQRQAGAPCPRHAPGEPPAPARPPPPAQAPPRFWPDPAIPRPHPDTPAFSWPRRLAKPLPWPRPAPSRPAQGCELAGGQRAWGSPRAGSGGGSFLGAPGEDRRHAGRWQRRSTARGAGSQDVSGAPGRAAARGRCRVAGREAATWVRTQGNPSVAVRPRAGGSCAAESWGRGADLRQLVRPSGTSLAPLGSEGACPGEPLPLRVPTGGTCCQVGGARAQNGWMAQAATALPGLAC